MTKALDRGTKSDSSGKRAPSGLAWPMKRARVSKSVGVAEEKITRVPAAAGEPFHALCRRELLSCDTLTSGQAFRCACLSPPLWRAPLGRRLYPLRFDADQVLFGYEPLQGPSAEAERALLHAYFR